MTAIVEPELTQLEALHTAIPGSTPFTGMQELDEHVRSHPHEFAVVIGPSISAEEATMYAQWARIHRPTLGVILLRHRIDNAVLADALRSGMREVVDAADLPGVIHAVQRAGAVATAMAQTQMQEPTTSETAAARGILITVFSTKGGVGKSFVATNLASVLAHQGSKVCLVDLDVHGGDVAIMLQLNPTHQLNDLAAFNGVIDQGAAASLLTEHSPRLSVVAAPIQIDAYDQASPDEVGQLLEQLKSMFDVVVVDTSGIFDDHALAALDRTDTLVLVGTLDIPALKALKLATGTLDLLNFPRERWRFVLNRADSKVGLSDKEFEDTLGLKADCRLVSSREALAAVNRGEALVRAYPSHPNSKAFASFAAGLVDEAASPSGPGPTSTGSRRATSNRRMRLRKVT